MKVTAKELSIFLKKIQKKERYFEEIEKTQEGAISRFFEETLSVSKELSIEDQSYYLILGTFFYREDFIFEFERKIQIEAIMNLKIESPIGCIYKPNQEIFFLIGHEKILPQLSKILKEEEYSQWIKKAVREGNIKSFMFFKDFVSWLPYYYDSLSFDTLNSLLSFKNSSLNDLATKYKSHPLSLFLKNQIKTHKESLLKSESEIVIGNAVMLAENEFSEDEKYKIIYEAILRSNNFLKKSNHPIHINNQIKTASGKDAFIKYCHEVFFKTIVFSFNKKIWKKAWERLSKENKGLYKYELPCDLTPKEEQLKEEIHFGDFCLYLKNVGFNVPKPAFRRFNDKSFAQTKKELFLKMEIETNLSEEETRILIKQFLSSQNYGTLKKIEDVIMQTVKIKMLSDFPDLVSIGFDRIEFNKIFRDILIDYIILSDERLEIDDDKYDILLLNYKH